MDSGAKLGTGVMIHGCFRSCYLLRHTHIMSVIHVGDSGQSIGSRFIDPLGKKKGDSRCFNK